MNLHTSVTESFSAKLMEILDHVEYRRVESSEDMKEVARIRYKAYKMADILPLTGTQLIDDVDFDPFFPQRLKDAEMRPAARTTAAQRQPDPLVLPEPAHGAPAPTPGTSAWPTRSRPRRCPVPRA